MQLSRCPHIFKVNYKGLDIHQVVASLYNCAVSSNLRSPLMLSPAFDPLALSRRGTPARHHFVTSDMVKERLVETPLNPETDIIEIGNIEIEDIPRFIGITVENVFILVTYIYEHRYGWELPKKIITVLRFFQNKNNITLHTGELKTLWQLSADAVDKYRNILYGNLFKLPEDVPLKDNKLTPDYQLKLQYEATKLLKETFSSDDVTYMSIKPLYRLVGILSSNKDSIYNNLIITLTELGKKMGLANPTPEISSRFTALRKNLIQLLNNYNKEKGYTLSCSN